ncbi:hypothetical protein ABTZ59_34210 [Streptomyces sp. NPDC094034]|uniref:hypothetical protein n=1 Tax=Streptomyces sp. NPDC094034 TaxID=3155309 RepID=UPI0033336AEF
MIGRALGAPMHHVRQFLYQSGGIRPVDPSTSALSNTFDTYVQQGETVDWSNDVELDFGNPGTKNADGATSTPVTTGLGRSATASTVSFLRTPTLLCWTALTKHRTRTAGTFPVRPRPGL